ncbi:hypothetical protein FRC02_003928 [Tulasnella sp. 418]|nr:hypothetical protein FRC02_003928 [Tulasnella sp. 418]
MFTNEESRAILASASYDFLWRDSLDRFRQKLKGQREGVHSDSSEEEDSDSGVSEEDLDWGDVELPECPPGIPAWRYASMAFGDRCDRCGAPGARVNMFNILTRICEPCFPIHVAPGKYILSNVLRKEEHFLFLSLPVVKVPDEFFETHRRASYYLPFLKEFLSQYRSLPHEGRVGDSASRWVEDFKASMRRWSEAGDMLRDWVREKERPRVQWVQAQLNRQILKKLKDEGWLPHDYPTDSETWKSLVSREDQFSEEALTIIVAYLRPLLETRRAQRQYLLQGTEREIRREKFIMTQYAIFKREVSLSDPTSKRLLFPGPQKMFRIPELEFLRSTDVSDVLPGWTSFLPSIKRSLIRGTEGARKEIRMWYELSSVMAPESWRDIAETGVDGDHIMELMSRATPPDMDSPCAVFACRDCMLPLWLDTVHQHEHFAAQWKWNKDTDIEPLNAEAIQKYPFTDNGLPDGPGSLIYDPQLVQIVEQLLKSIEPLTFSLWELLDQGESFMCALCARNEQKPIGFGCLATHHRNHQLLDANHSTPLFLILPPAEAIAALEDWKNRLRSSNLDENHARAHMLHGLWRKDFKCEICVSERKPSRYSETLERWQTWEEMVYHLYDG